MRKLQFIFILFFISCAQQQQKQIGTKGGKIFADYLKSLDTIPVPFEHACAGPSFPEISMHFDSVGFEEFKDADCARPLGILFNDKKNVVLVDLSNGDFCIVPMLVSFDKKGHKLDSLNLYQSSYMDTASSSMPYFRIDKNKTILVIDTAKSWKTDQSNKVVVGSDTTTIYSTEYHLSEKGKFVKGIRKKL